MIVYRLTSLGESLSHNPRGGRTPGWMVIYQLAKYGAQSSEQLYASIPGLTSTKLAKLVRNRIIYNNALPTVE